MLQPLTKEKVWFYCCCNDGIIYHRYLVGSRKLVEAVGSIVPQTCSTSGQALSTQDRLGVQSTYFNGYYITIIGMIIEHKYLFQVTRMLGCVVTPMRLSCGRHSHQAHHGHCSHHGRHGLQWPLNVMVIHKTMHITRITWMFGLAKHRLVKTRTIMSSLC